MYMGPQTHVAEKFERRAMSSASERLVLQLQKGFKLPALNEGDSIERE